MLGSGGSVCPGLVGRVRVAGVARVAGVLDGADEPPALRRGAGELAEVTRERALGALGGVHRAAGQRVPDLPRFPGQQHSAGCPRDHPRVEPDGGSHGHSRSLRS